MRTALRYCLCGLIFLPCFLFADEAGKRNLLADNHFENGVRITPPANIRFGFLPQNITRAVPVCLPQRDCSKKPAWQLQQWSNAQDIADAHADGALYDEKSNIQKRFQLKPNDLVAGDVLLEMNGLSEFAARSEDGVPHYISDLGKPWPHWLLSQQLESGRLAQYSHLMLSGQIKLLFDSPQRREGYDPAIHAARLLLAITVRNRLTGDYFWLTLPLYDDRYPHTDFGCQKCTDDGGYCVTPQFIGDPVIAEYSVWRCPEDRVGEQWQNNEKTGTARMIFRVPTRHFLSSHITHDAVQLGHWVQVSGDLLPYVKAGIEAVRQRENGKRFPADSFFYELGLFSVGWEITGFNHVAVQMRDWQLVASP